MLRTLTLRIDCETAHCNNGSAQKCRYLTHDTEMGVCRLFIRTLKMDDTGSVLRCDACLKAETDDPAQDEGTVRRV